MNNTGTYTYDKESKKIVKVSDDIPSIACDVSFGGKESYLDENLGEMTYPHKANDGSTDYERPVWKPYEVTSKKDKARRMKELGLVEKGGRDVKPHGKTQYHDLTRKDATVFVGRP